MLIFNEGVPGAGKTYDAIEQHLLPALKKGRRVYARINGLNYEAIAEYLNIDVARVRELLIHIPSADVQEVCTAVRDADGELTLREEHKNALFLIDEAHEFWVAARNAMPQEQEQWFAIHRHYGADIVLMTQWYKRLHTALRARIERKNVFQKLTAVSMKNHYRVTFYQTVSPDRYAKTGGETRKYRPEIFPLYRGVAGDDVQTEVYEGGSRSVWKTLAVPSVIMALLLGVSAWWLFRFFTGDASMVKAAEVEPVGAPVSDLPPGVWQEPMSDEARPVAAAKPVPPPPPPDPVDKMTPEQAHVWRIAKGARARAAASMGQGASAWGVIEFREKNQPPVEVLTTRQLQAMGVEIQPTAYGFVLRAGGEVIIATAWPTNEVVRPSHHELYRLDRDQPAAPALASNASNAGPAGRVQPLPVYSSGYAGTVGAPTVAPEFGTVTRRAY